MTLVGANTSLASFTAPSAPTASSITLQLTVTDSLAATASATVIINVAAVPPPPPDDTPEPKREEERRDDLGIEIPEFNAIDEDMGR